MEDALEDAGDDDEWRVKIASELAVPASLAVASSPSAGHTPSRPSGRPSWSDRSRPAGEGAWTTLRHVGRHRVKRSATTWSRGCRPWRIPPRCRSPSTTSRAPRWVWGSTLPGDSEPPRPLLERAAQRALARGQEWDRLGMLARSGRARMGERQPATSRSTIDRPAEEALGEFAEDVLWLDAQDARRALERGGQLDRRAGQEPSTG